MKYLVGTHELCWYNCYYTVEADSEEEAQELVKSGFGDFDSRDYDTLEELNIESIEEIKE